ncbi:FAD-dependent monooxygenase [Sphingosinicella sp. GR2756]|uniref:FAD-dependent monooxygenase n=1 Tax=Sphingosinicella rhizophila TaxID=3050082 RepID=A0ABU3Q8H8_9SPHN|nr:FAD-dependent monooxygenase [Sphingosinicella sp. GR2756]
MAVHDAIGGKSDANPAPDPRRTDILIVGGGPAGCAAAISLARTGISAELFERSHAGHDVVCGGFLGWDALRALARLGIDAASLGARPIRKLRLLAGGRQVEASLPQPAAGLSRRTLDAALLGAAADAGAAVHRGRAVRAADVARNLVRMDDGEEIEAGALLLANGKYELRGAARPRDTAGDPIGIRTSLETPGSLRTSLEGVIELHLFDGGYAGLLLQEDGSANLCLSVARQSMKRAGGIENLVAEIAARAPALADRLADGAASEWMAVSAVPYGWRARETSPGLFRLGDQAAVIASIAGDGIAIALESGIAAASTLVGQEPDARNFQRAFAQRTRRPVMVAETIRWAAEHGAARFGLMRLVGANPALASLAARLTRIGA